MRSYPDNYSPFYILDDKNNPIQVSGEEYGSWMDKHISTRKRVKKTTFFEDTKNEIFISTVFLGIDHGDYYLYSISYPHKEYKPIVFETMIFWEGNELDQEGMRYHTYKEAQIGHRDAVRKVIKKLREMNNGK